MTTLEEEVSKPEYAGLSNLEVADAINAKTVPDPGGVKLPPVPLWTLLGVTGPVDHGAVLVARGHRWEDYVTLDPSKPHEHNPALVAAKRVAYEEVLSEAEARNDPAASRLAQVAADEVRKA